MKLNDKKKTLINLTQIATIHADTERNEALPDPRFGMTVIGSGPHVAILWYDSLPGLNSDMSRIEKALDNLLK